MQQNDDASPVPGAAVRALVGEFGRLVEDDWAASKSLRDSISLSEFAARAWAFGESKRMLEAALRADGLASVELQTLASAEELVAIDHLRGRVNGTRKYARSEAEANADCATLLAFCDRALARRPATEEAEAPGDVTDSEQWQVRAEAAEQRIADLESQLASVTAERDCLRDPNDPHNDARRFEARLQQEIADGKRLVRERDEALAKLAGLEQELAEAHNAQRDLHTDVELLREKLAARPEPLVIDEALARKLAAALVSGDWAAGRGTRECLEALRQVFGGDHASVSVHGESAGGVMVRDVSRAMNVLTSAGIPTNRPDGCFMKLHKRVQALAEERDQLRAELALVDGIVQQWEANDSATRAELEKTRAELEACRERRDELEHVAVCQDEEFSELREQHEALRAAVFVPLGIGEALSAALEEKRDTIVGPATAALYWAARRLHAAQAILKPAPAEAEPVRCDYGDECPGHASPGDRPCGWEPVQHPPPESAMVDSRPLAGAGEWLFVARFAPPEETLTARVERLERDNGLLWRVVEAIADGDAQSAAYAACKERRALDARKGAV